VIYKVGADATTQHTTASGALTAVLTLTIFTTPSHATFPMGGVGGLKCYTTDGSQKTCRVLTGEIHVGFNGRTRASHTTKWEITTR
jgi:hypothetical protein